MVRGEAGPTRTQSLRKKTMKVTPKAPVIPVQLPADPGEAAASPTSAPAEWWSPPRIEALAKEHEAFGSGHVDARCLATHGFDPEGLHAFVQALIGAERTRGSDLVEAQVEWEPCDCGCPGGRSPKSAADVRLLRLASALRMGRDASSNNAMPRGLPNVPGNPAVQGSRSVREIKAPSVATPDRFNPKENL